MNNERERIIKEVVEELIGNLGFSATVAVTSETTGEYESFRCSAHVGEGQNFLIGQYGMNLAALQHLVRILVRKKLGERFEIIVDVNDYFSEKRQLLEKEAAAVLEEVLQNNISVAMRPMLPYERKIVHAFFSGNESVTTESIGEGEGRKVMISPRPTETK